MTTIPARLAVMTRQSADLKDAASRARVLYRDWYRAAPEVVQVYQLDLSVYDFRTKIREQFSKHKHVTDVRVIDILLLKGRQEYQETLNIWKQTPHVLAWFKEQEDNASPQTFMDKFLAGRDESHVQNFH
ncbi:NADH:ubiquinone oxidoreductase, NDUFA6/B14 subunit [Phaffia rhodozyma]|uniref:NADH:ubiquinone oxidoreductase, NDUFA6/B14 subunit n=1 Tax=Phaffia rhodozyma TaxID=264483 RepID=A0A0F7SSX5_PHARH|nr:NADH:ubiquinone oxidoreductase, NDUFA6/B14 subunit [Phaffia rhodozyma]